jgi:hypothetical protein
MDSTITSIHKIYINIKTFHVHNLYLNLNLKNVVPQVILISIWNIITEGNGPGIYANTSLRKSHHNFPL